MSSPDIFYYNMTVGNLDPSKVETYNGDGVKAEIEAYNNLPIVDNVDDYYCSIIRFSIPAFNLPLINFLVQTPVKDINLGVYSFTIGDGTNFGEQNFVIYEPQQIQPPWDTPKPNTLTQTFGNYYFCYDYTWFIMMLNKALANAVASYNTKFTKTESVPFFNYDASTQLISLYTTVSGNWERNSATPVYIYFNNALSNYMTGLPYNTSRQFTTGYTPTDIGCDNLINIDINNGLNVVTIPAYGGGEDTQYIKTTYQYNAYGYWSFLKSLLITTNMNVEAEAFFLNDPSGKQNVKYTNVLTDFQPDFSVANGAGISAQILNYDAPSLYRIFQFKQKTPLYKISLNINYTDTYGNIYPLYLDIGQQANFKLMFIKKTLYKQNNFLLN
jgi:hypothetical protein